MQAWFLDTKLRNKLVCITIPAGNVGVDAVFDSVGGWKLVSWGSLEMLWNIWMWGVHILVSQRPKALLVLIFDGS